jgi:hypothetical protein
MFHEPFRRVRKTCRIRRPYLLSSGASVTVIQVCEKQVFLVRQAFGLTRSSACLGLLLVQRVLSNRRLQLFRCWAGTHVKHEGTV